MSNKIQRLRANALIMSSALAVSLAACSDEPQIIEVPEAPVEDSAYDGEWIRLDGTVVTTAPSSFLLDYGSETITVEVDDWDFYEEGDSLLPGDRVSVTGRMDENVLGSDTIEASAVYLHNLKTVYFANSTDEEDLGLGAIPMRAAAQGVDYTGWVTGTSENGFTLGAGATLISVDTSELDTPLAENGVDTGDRVYVWGDLEISPETGTKLAAEGLIELISSSQTTAPADEGAAQAQEEG